MAAKSGMKFMTGFVREYLYGTLERLDWDCDFNHYLIKHYPKMDREDRDLAECFNFYLAEQGFDLAGDLPDNEHRKFIHEQFAKFEDIRENGFW